MQNTKFKCEIHVVSAGSWMLSQKIRLVTHWHFGKSSLNNTSILIGFFVVVVVFIFLVGFIYFPSFGSQCFFSADDYLACTEYGMLIRVFNAVLDPSNLWDYCCCLSLDI